MAASEFLADENTRDKLSFTIKVIWQQVNHTHNCILQMAKTATNFNWTGFADRNSRNTNVVFADENNKDAHVDVCLQGEENRLQRPQTS